ncbi:MAG TPA: hypothetical protein VE996_02730 [Terriglobales bacterium]|nr:hypothetical protein [Terriglobales bacterium]
MFHELLNRVLGFAVAGLISYCGLRWIYSHDDWFSATVRLLAVETWATLTASLAVYAVTGHSVGMLLPRSFGLLATKTAVALLAVGGTCPIIFLYELYAKWKMGLETTGRRLCVDAAFVAAWAAGFVAAWRYAPLILKI